MKVQAVVFDWAGTIVDHGSRGPVAALLDVFAQAGAPITVAEARESMGIAKRDHIRTILQLPRVAEAWVSVSGRSPGEADLDALYTAFLPKRDNRACLRDHSAVIAGIPRSSRDSAIARNQNRIHDWLYAEHARFSWCSRARTGIYCGLRNLSTGCARRRPPGAVDVLSQRDPPRGKSPLVDGEDWRHAE